MAPACSAPLSSYVQSSCENARYRQGTIRSRRAAKPRLWLLPTLTTVALLIPDEYTIILLIESVGYFFIQTCYQGDAVHHTGTEATDSRHGLSPGSAGGIDQRRITEKGGRSSRSELGGMCDTSWVIKQAEMAQLDE